MRIPLGYDLARIHGISIIHQQGGPIGDLVALPFAAEFISDANFARAGHRDQRTGVISHRLGVVQSQCSLALDLNIVHRGRA